MENSIIYYRDIDSPLGIMIAGASERGICFLEWHDRGGIEAIKKRVVKRYRCKLTPGESRHIDLLEIELKAYFDKSLFKFTVPVDIKGTPFEKAVWEQLLKIPQGQTRSYGEIASLLGKPEAVRAVGRANGANYISIVIPCHRVIAANGKLQGYGGKLWRKEKLLQLEGALVI